MLNILRLFFIILTFVNIYGKPTENYYVNILAFKQEALNTSENNSFIPIGNQEQSSAFTEITNKTNTYKIKNILFNKTWIIPRTKLLNKPYQYINIDFDDKIHAHGNIGINLNHFFNCKIKININKDDSSIPINEHRRMRKNQLNYFDHPYIGFIVNITSKI